MTVVKEVISALDTIAKETSRTEHSRVWTEKIKWALQEIGKSKGYWVYGLKENAADDFGEWVFDLCWLDYDGNWLKSVPLALESEWHGWGNATDDFQKLLIARAELKVFVFAAKTKADAPRCFGVLQDYVDRFSGSTSEDRYLLASWCNDSGEFVYKEMGA